MVCIEVGLIFALRAGLTRGVRWPVTLMAVLAALFLTLGVLRHYVDIYVHRTVRGVSFIFCGIDAMGDLTSLISILFQPSLDVLGMVIYGVELALWIGVFVCGGYFNLRPWIKESISRRSGDTPSNRDSEVSSHEGSQHAGTARGEIALHRLPSSTSAFRTPSVISNTSNNIRSRTTHGEEHSLTTPPLHFTP